MIKHTIKQIGHDEQKGLEFFLTINEDKEVELRAEDHEGTAWLICTIRNIGVMELAGSLDKDAMKGISLEYGGYIKTTKD